MLLMALSLAKASGNVGSISNNANTDNILITINQL